MSLEHLLLSWYPSQSYQTGMTTDPARLRSVRNPRTYKSAAARTSQHKIYPHKEEFSTKITEDEEIST